MSKIVETYRARTQASEAMGTRAERVMPAGETRASGFHAPYPLTLTKGVGTRLWDIDGNEYIDLNSNYTSLAHGHAFPPIVEAVSRVVREGTAWPARNPYQVELAELLVARIPSVELVRFCNSGSEAGMLAMLVARTATGRQKILMARHGYHGSHEVFLHGSGAMGEWPHTLTANWGDADGFEAVLDQQGEQVAAVFLEAAMGGVVSAPVDFFRRVQAAAAKAGAVFVLDEVITFRMSTGGQQKLWGLDPDLTMFGKIIGGGFPVGALGGKQELMNLLDPREGRINHSGTFNGNPVTTAAGIVSVTELTAERIAIMAGQAEELAGSLQKSAVRHGLPLSILREGSLLGVAFSGAPSAGPRPGDGGALAKFHLAGMNRGLYFSSRGLLVLSTVLTEGDLAEIGGRFDAALADVAGEA